MCACVCVRGRERFKEREREIVYVRVCVSECVLNRVGEKEVGRKIERVWCVRMCVRAFVSVCACLPL